MGLKKLPPPDVLNDLLRYDAEVGKLFWRKRSVRWFKASKCRGYERSAEWAMRNWNARFAGKEAFTHRDRKGYAKGAVLSINCSAHRVIYALHHGVEVDGFIDHINGDKSDNRIANLRVVSNAENAKNAALYSSNKSGTSGVMWEDSHKAWAVKINIGGKQRRIGRYKVKADAVAARKNAEVLHGYHENHGRLATGG